MLVDGRGPNWERVFVERAWERALFLDMVPLFLGRQKTNALFCAWGPFGVGFCLSPQGQAWPGWLASLRQRLRDETRVLKQELRPALGWRARDGATLESSGGGGGGLLRFSLFGAQSVLRFLCFFRDLRVFWVSFLGAPAKRWLWAMNVNGEPPPKQ